MMMWTKQKVKVLSFSHVWLFATPQTVAHQAPLPIGFSRQEYWNWLPFPSPEHLPNPRIKPGSFPCRRILYHLRHQESTCKSFFCVPHVYMHTHKEVSELFILYDYLRCSHPHFGISKTEAWSDETPHLYIYSSSSDPGANALLKPHGVIGPVTWTVFWGFTHARACVQHRLWWEGALEDWTAQQLFCMWYDIYKHGLLSCSLRGQNIESRPLMPIPSLAGKSPSAKK